jgi:phospholipid-transporting ATPase
MVFLPVYATVAPILGFSEEYAGILPHLYTTLLFWCSVVVIPILCLLRDFAWK